MSDQTSHIKYRPEVDGLRALAVIPVMLFHAGFELFSGGFVGVDVFFVISGYLITTVILTEVSSGGFSIVGFYERRARRILPALFLVMVVCIPFAWFWMVPAELRGFSRGMVAVPLFASNVLFWKTSGYFGSSAEENPLLHTWSLGVEEQYYIVFPLFVLLSWRLGRRRQAWLIFGIAIISLALSEWGWRNHPMGNFYLAPTRAWELLIGSLLGFATFNAPLYERVSARRAEVLSCLGVLLVLGAIVGYDKATPVPSLYALAPTLGTAMILGFSGAKTLVARCLSAKWIVVIGLVSYSAYLWHVPLFAMARLRSPTRPSQLVFIALSGAAMALAYLTWRYVESPFRNRKKIARKAIFGLSVATSLLFVALGLAGEVNEGFPGRLHETSLASMATAMPSPMRDTCHTQGRDFLDPARACVYFNQNVTWATFGDSHIVELAYALAERLDIRDQGLVHLSFSLCPPALLFEVAQPGCTKWLNESLVRLEGDDRIRNILVGFRYGLYLFGSQLHSYPAIPDSRFLVEGLSPDESRELYWKSFKTILDRLQRSGKRVFVLAPVPELGRPVQQTIFAAQIKGNASVVPGASRAYYEARNRYVLDKFKTLKWGSNLIPVDPALALCNEKTCNALLDGVAMYFDDNHLSVAGARRVLMSTKHILDE